MDILPDSPNYFPFSGDERIIRVGWLNPMEKFDQGPVSHDFVNALFRLLQNPWQPAIAMGIHHCPFCPFSGGPGSFCLLESNTSISLGQDNLFVPAEGRIFLAPSLIIHYIDAHQFCPSQEFQEAVLACPEMRSMDYLKALRANAPQSLLQFGRPN